jgi:hypothetical protein
VTRAARPEKNLLPAPVLADIVARLEDIHQRLLLFSTSIELEIDRLDMVQAEIEGQTSNPTRRRSGSSSSSTTRSK